MVIEESTLNLQIYLDFAYKMTQDWLNKCLVINYRHYNEKRHLLIDGIQLHEYDIYRDLGYIFSRNLKWNILVFTEMNKANQMLFRIKKSFSKFDCYRLRSLYLTFI